MPHDQPQTIAWRDILPPVLYWGVLGATVFGAGAVAFGALAGRGGQGVLPAVAALLGALAGILFGCRRASLRRLRRRLDASEGHLQTLQRIMPAMLQALDADGRIVFVSQHWLDTLAYRGTQVIGRPFSDFLVAEYPAELLRDHLRTLREDGEIQGRRYRLRCGDGRELDVDVSECAQTDQAGRQTGSFAVLSTVARRPGNEEQLEKLIYHDSLTGLPNRHLLNDRLLHAILQARRDNSQVGVFYFDLDHFKAINDTQGHAVGDQVLRSVAQRLKMFIREGDTFARLGGDEFVIVQADPNQDPNFAILARRILEALGEPFRLGVREFYSTASVGIAIYPRDGDTPQTLLQNADTAMYAAKHRGRNNFQFFSREMNAQAEARAALAANLRQALEERALTLRYQPQVDLASGRIVAVEALLFWSGRDGQLIPSDDVVSVAEESGLIFPLGEWTLETACRQARLWQQAGLPPLRMVVNLSGHHIRQANFIDRLEKICQTTGMNLADLEIDLTETSVMGHVQEIIMALTDLTVRGVGLAIDDFGTGYSSLLYLKHFPIQRVKIAREFILGIGQNPDYAKIADAVISMTRSLELAVTAVGVENPAQLEFLRQHGCTEVAGFLLSPPLPPDEIARLFAGNANLLEAAMPAAKAR